MEKVDLPEGQSGAWKVERFEITEEDAKFSALRVIVTGRSRNQVVPGTYTRIVRGSVTVMSDTCSEMDDHRGAVARAKGRVLVAGLGLGMVVKNMLRKPEVEHITVIEKSPDVIALVAPHYSDPRLEIINADIFEWQPPKGVRFDVCWFDIWDYITADNLPEMTKLKRRYGRRTDWQGCWAEHDCRR